MMGLFHDQSIENLKISPYFERYFSIHGGLWPVLCFCVTSLSI